MKEPFVVTGMKDVEAIETVPFNERVAETNTFAVLEKGAAIEPQSVAISTGGTTGTPKLARRAPINEVVKGWMLRAMGGLGPDSTVLCGLPLFHVNGTTVTGITPASGVDRTSLGKRIADILARYTLHLSLTIKPPS